MSVPSEEMPSGLDILILREVGFRTWDPIGLCQAGEDWRGSPFEDEYDSYLCEAAARLSTGEPAENVSAFLQEIEIAHMGLGASDTVAPRALAAVREIGRLIGDCAGSSG